MCPGLTIHWSLHGEGIWHMCLQVKPPLVDSPNKGRLLLSGQHDMHRLIFSIQVNRPAKDTSI